MASRIDLWMSDKKSPVVKQSINGNEYLEVYASMQTPAYDEWLDSDKSSAAPDRYAYVTLRFFDLGGRDHAQKVYDWAISKEKDPRPNVHVVGTLNEDREYQGKQYYTMLVSDISPLQYGPLRTKKGA
jgi:hypothetical protein